jgi:hypothetical protein
MHLFKISAIFGGVAVAGLLAASPAAAQNPVGAVLGTAAAIAGAPYAFGGHNYCWAPDGWHGPGWYWCGYEHRHGYGWGGGEGFHGWHHGGGHMRGHMGGHGHADGHAGGHPDGHGSGHDHH